MSKGMTSDTSTPPHDPNTQLAQHIAVQRGVKRMKQQTLDQYRSALLDRMRVIRKEMDRTITGADVYATINSPTVVADPVAWEDAPTWEQELYSEAARVFSEQQADPLSNAERETMDAPPHQPPLTLQDVKTLAEQVGVTFLGSASDAVFELDSTNGYLFAGTYENSQMCIEAAYSDLRSFQLTVQKIEHR